mmetsp:Transcript_9234/g.28691  ORF Transcript_9234/g.28691 Transcript_9234/m.28691 type:complete len:204 (+) Transcript_9234:458-1069(+)
MLVITVVVVLLGVVLFFFLPKVGPLVLCGHALFVHPPSARAERRKLCLGGADAAELLAGLVHALPANALKAATVLAIRSLPAAVDATFFNDSLVALGALCLVWQPADACLLLLRRRGLRLGDALQLLPHEHLAHRFVRRRLWLCAAGLPPRAAAPLARGRRGRRLLLGRRLRRGGCKTTAEVERCLLEVRLGHRARRCWKVVF